MDKVEIPYIYFGSGMKEPYNMLSNFHYCIVEGPDGRTYPSIEHAYQSNYILEKDMFASGGILSEYSTGFPLVFEEKVDKKLQYWSRKNNIGILAKMAVSNKKIMSKLKLNRVSTFESSWEIWRELLLSKFRQPKFKEILLSTGDAHLIEFNRGAMREEMNGKSPKWTGMIKDGRLYGQNLMGQYLMRIRLELRSEK